MTSVAYVTSIIFITPWPNYYQTVGKNKFISLFWMVLNRFSTPNFAKNCTFPKICCCVCDASKERANFVAKIQSQWPITSYIHIFGLIFTIVVMYISKQGSLDICGRLVARGTSPVAYVTRKMKKSWPSMSEAVARNLADPISR